MKRSPHVLFSLLTMSVILFGCDLSVNPMLDRLLGDWGMGSDVKHFLSIEADGTYVSRTDYRAGACERASGCYTLAGSRIKFFAAKGSVTESDIEFDGETLFFKNRVTGVTDGPYVKQQSLPPLFEIRWINNSSYDVEVTYTIDGIPTNVDIPRRSTRSSYTCEFFHVISFSYSPKFYVSWNADEKTFFDVDLFFPIGWDQ